MKRSKSFGHKMQNRNAMNYAHVSVINDNTYKWIITKQSI